MTVTFTATVDNPPLGDQTLVSTASSAAAANNCPAGSADPTCQVTVPMVSVQTLTITKATLGGVTVTWPGQVVHYVITMTNSAPTPFVDATFTDSLADVLDDATYNNDVSQVSSPLATGECRVQPGGLDHHLDRHRAGAGDRDRDLLGDRARHSDREQRPAATRSSRPPPGTNCPSGNGDARCTSTIPVAELDHRCSPRRRPPATPGQTVTFQATIRTPATPTTTTSR